MYIQSLFAYGYLPLLLTLLLIFTVGLLYMVIKPSKGEIKNSRYEAGNLPHGEARKKTGFQYFGYIALFASIEPVIILLLIISPASGYYYNKLLITILFALAILIPIIIYGIKIAENPKNWRWR